MPRGSAAGQTQTVEIKRAVADLYLVGTESDECSSQRARTTSGWECGAVPQGLHVGLEGELQPAKQSWLWHEIGTEEGSAMRRVGDMIHSPLGGAFHCHRPASRQRGLAVTLL